MPAVDAFSAVTGANGGTPAGGLGTISWVRAVTYDFRNCLTSARVTSGTVVSGGVLPSWTLASDSGSTFGATPTAGVGIVLDSSGLARGFIHFTPDYATLGIDFLSPTPFVVTMQVDSPAFGASAFLTFQLGSAANPNGSGSGAGGRVINSGGTRNGNARSNSSGTPELSSSTLFSIVGADPANVSFCGGFYPGENVDSILNGTLPLTGPAGFTFWRDGATRTIGTGAGYLPGFVSLLFGGGTITGAAISVVELWTRRVV